MNPLNLLFEALNELSGGLLADSTTVTLACIVIGFFAFGADILIEKLHSMAASGALSNAQAFHAMRDTYETGSFEYSYYNSLYQSSMRNSLEHRRQSGGGFADFYIGIQPPDSARTSSGKSSSFSKGGFDTEFDALKSEGYSLEEAFPELADNSSPPSYYRDDPGPSSYGPPPEDEYYGPY